jgi:DNA-binding MarR family transcriptional regulator
LTNQVSVKGLERLSPLEGGAWGGFLQAHGTLVRCLDDDLRATHGLTLSSYEALLFLAWSPGRRMRMGELAGRVLITLSGVTRLIGRLEREGLVRRERSSEDGRGHYAVLTEAGLLRLREAHPTHLAGVRQLFLQHFNEEELQTLAGFWDRVSPRVPPENTSS